MTMPVWTFAERSENDVEQEVTEVDQFNSETVDLQETLIRESAQNSQDARAGAHARSLHCRSKLRTSTSTAPVSASN